MLAAEAVAQTSPAPAATPPNRRMRSPTSKSSRPRSMPRAACSRGYRDALKGKGPSSSRSSSRSANPTTSPSSSNGRAPRRARTMPPRRQPGVSRRPRAALDRALRRTSALCPVGRRPEKRRRPPPCTSSPMPTSCRPSARMVSPQVRNLAEASSRHGRQRRCNALVQASRLNHLTLVEAWTDAAAQRGTQRGPLPRHPHHTGR